MLFQSTRPRRARQIMKALVCILAGFNPRAHAGRDGITALKNYAMSVSIHAPTQGATTDPFFRWLVSSFNPRAHAGRDIIFGAGFSAGLVSIHAPTQGATVAPLVKLVNGSFNPRAHAGRDFFTSCFSQFLRRFNPRAHAGRDINRCTYFGIF